MNNEKEAFLEGERQWLDPDNDYHYNDDSELTQRERDEFKADQEEDDF